MVVINKAEKSRMSTQLWREANRERHRAYSRQYRKDHAEEVSKKNKDWAEANPEKMNEYHRRSRSNNPEGYRAITQRYRESHPGFMAACCKTRRARRKGAEGKLSLSDWEHIKTSFGNRCARCGIKRRMSLDHIVPLSKGGSHDWSNSQPLCVPCNSSKHTATIDYRKSSPFFDRKFYEARFSDGE